MITSPIISNNLLTRYSDNDLKNATQLPEALYVVKVGKLHHQTPVVYKGLNDDQEAVLHILHALFAADVTCLENKSNSIQRLQYFMRLFDNSIMKSEQDEQILNDFYAIESARSTLPTESLERYFRIFQQNVKKVIPARIERINAFKCALLNTDSFSKTNTTPCENDQILLDSALLSLTPDELLSICQRQGFLNPHRIALILQVPGHEVMHPHIKNAIKNIDVFNDVLARSPKKCWHSLAKAVGTENLIELCRYQRLGNNLALWAVNCSEDRLYFIENVLGIETLKKIIQKGGYSDSPLHSMHYLSTQICAHLNQDHISKLMNKLGVDYLKDVCTDLHDLIFVLQHLQPSEKINFLRMKGDVFLQKEVVFYGYLDNLLKHIPKQSWPDVLQMLGSRAFEIANDRLFLSSLEVTKQEREVIRYAQYYTSFRPAYLRQFSDAAPLHSSIADFFRGILGYQKYLSGHFFTNGDEIAQRVIEMCNKNPPPSKTELLSHLEGRLNGIFHTSLHYSILNRPPRFNGETAMRLLFCIEKVRASMTTQPSPAPRLSRILN